tara:strand:+ start:29 stop:1966 length:1938 start_codon:yes stop_codon:yes gene_type:complete
MPKSAKSCFHLKKTSGKRPATAAGKQPVAKRPRAEVHPLQDALAKRAFAHHDSQGVIIAATMGTGKPRIGGKLLDLYIPKLVEDREEDVPGVLTIVVVTDAKHGREQAAQYGTDFPGPYHDSELGAVLNLLKGEGHAARIMIPFATFRKMCYAPKGGTCPLWNLLEKLGQPEVVFLIDEVTEVYKPRNGRLPKAIDALRTKYEKVTDATIRVVGMSGTPELDDAENAARAKTLFGVAPTLVEFTKEEEAELLEAINPQRKVSTREQGVVETLPAPTEPAEQLKQLSTLVVGNALFCTELSLGDAAVKKVAGEVLVQQVLGDDQDGGVLFQKLAKSGEAPMLAVNKDGAIGKKPSQKLEAVLVAVDSPYGTQALYDALAELQERSGTDGELRGFTVHDLRLEAQITAAKGADKVPHAYLVKRDVADQKAALKAFLADAAAQKGTAIAIIDKRQALSGTNDFAKNVQRAIAIGAWESHELDQFYKRLCRAALLEQGDLVPKVFYGVHIASPFAANLTAKADRRGVGTKAALSEEAKAELGTLEAAAANTIEGKAAYRKAEDVATMLGATQLPNDPALKYLKCLSDDMEQETFKVGEYKPLIEHHEDCEREELNDETTGEKKTKVVACCEACKCIFTKVAVVDDEAEA